MLAEDRLVTGTETTVTTLARPENGSESVPECVEANSLPDAPVPRHTECGSHPAPGEEIKLATIIRRGGRRPNAGRKPASHHLAEARIAASIASVASPVQSGDRWYCVSTHYRMELIALDQLVRQGYPAFLPRVERELPDLHRVTAPMFPRYLFVRFDRDIDRWRPIASTVGVRCLFGVSPERPIPVPFGEVERLIAKADANGMIADDPVPALEDIVEGDAVWIDMPFARLRGICRLSAAGRIRVLTEMMGHEVEVEAARASVELIRPA